MRMHGTALILLFSGLFFFTAAGAQTLSIRADQWMPMNGDPGAPRPGFAIEILHAIFRPMGIRIDYQLDSWSRSVRLARNGDIDCIVGVYRGEAPDLLFPQQPLAFDETAFYVAAGSDWRYQGVDSLSGERVGVIDGYSYGDVVDDWLASDAGQASVAVVYGLQPLRRNLRKLLAGRLDVIIESPFVMEAMIRELRLSGAITEAGRIESPPTPLYLACSPARETSARYLSEFDDGMAMLRESGELARIMARYGLSVPPQVAR